MFFSEGTLALGIGCVVRSLVSNISVYLSFRIQIPILERSRTFQNIRWIHSRRILLVESLYPEFGRVAVL